MHENWELEKLTGSKTPPAGIIHSISKTENGLMVFCTNQGIYSFDGYNYRHLLDDFTELKDWRYRYCRWAFFKNQKIYMVFPQGIRVVDIRKKRFEKHLFFGDKRALIYAIQVGDLIFSIHSDGFVYKTKLSDLSTKLVRNDLGRAEWGSHCGYKSASLMFRTHSGEIRTIDTNGKVNTILRGVKRLRDLELYFGENGEVTGLHSNGTKIWLGDTGKALISASSVIHDTTILKSHNLIFRFYSFSSDLKVFYCESAVWLLKTRNKRNNILLPGHSSRAIYAIEDSLLFISTYVGFYHFNKEGKSVKLDSVCNMSYDIHRVPRKPNIVRMLTECSGISEYDLKTKKVRTKLYGSGDYSISGHVFINDTTTFFYGRKLFLFNEVTNEFKWIKSVDWYPATIRSVLPIGKNKIVCAGGKGLFVIDLQTGITTAIHSGDFRWGLRVPGTFKMLFGVIGQGILELDISSLKVKEFVIPELNRTASYFVYSALVRPGTDELVLGTGTGLYLLNLKTRDIRKVPTQMVEFNSNSLYFSDINTLYAGGIGGVEIIRFDKLIPLSNYALRPFLIEQRQHIDDGSEFDVFHLLSSEIRILPNAYETELFFNSSLDYLGKQHSWRYRVKGLHENWITKNNTVGQRLSIILAALKPGNYILELQLKNADGNWGEVFQWNIYKSPRWYEMLWVKTLFVLMISLLVYLSIRYYYSLREKENIDKLNTLMLRKNLIQSEIKSLRNQLNPHMFANSMQTIQYYILSKSKIEAVEYVAKYSHLMRRNLENGEHDFVFLADEIEFLKQFSELEIMRRSDAVQFDLKTQSGLEIDKFKIPSMIVQPFLENAFKHGKTSPEEDALYIFIDFYWDSEKGLHCKIVNSIDNQNSRQVERLVSGIEITKSRLQLYNQVLNQKGSVSFNIESYRFICELIIPYQLIEPIEI